MRDAFDDIERELRAVRPVPGAAVASRRCRRSRSSRCSRSAAAPRWRPRGSRATRTPSARARSSRCGPLRDTSRAPACSYSNRQPKPVLGDVALLHGIAATLPELSTPAEGADPERILDLARMPPSGMVLRQTVRTVDLAGGVRLTVYVVQGPHREHRDAAACTAARKRRAAQLATGEVLAAAERRIDAMRDTTPEQQMLFVSLQEPGVSGSFSVGLSVLPREPLKPGIIGSGSGANGDPRYLGIADPRVDRIHVEPERGRPKTAHVHQGFYAFTLARGLGKVRLREFDAAGATLRTFSLRG